MSDFLFKIPETLKHLRDLGAKPGSGLNMIQKC